MKLTLKVIFCSVFLLACVYSFQAQESKTALTKDSSKKNDNISTKYNKSKNLTTVTMKSMALTENPQDRPPAGYSLKVQMDMDAFFTYPGEKVEKPVEAATLRFHSSASNYIFARPQQISVVLDEKEASGKGRILKLGDTDYKNDLKFNSLYEEFMTIQIPADALAAIGNAKTVSIYVGGYSYILKEKQIADIREMASRMKP